MDAALNLSALFYAMFWWFLIVGFIGLPLLLIMLGVPAWRRPLLRHPRKVAVMALVCGSVVGLTSYQLWLNHRERELLNPRLDHAVVVGELALPAGARVHLNALEPLDANGEPQTHGLASLSSVEFPAPHVVAGITVSALRLYFPPDTEMLLAADQVIDGFPCAGGTWVTVSATEQTRLQPERWRFTACTLVAGSVIAAETWPAQSRVSREGDAYTVHNWLAEAPVSLRGIVLSNVIVTLDAQRRLLHWEGQLENPVTVGEWQYPHGTTVAQNRPDTLMFSPSPLSPASNLRTGQSLRRDHSILQRQADGRVLWIKPNGEIDAPDS
jgi:hypothetical protein